MHGNKLNQEAVSQYSRSFSSIILDDFFTKNEGINGQQIISVTPVKQVNFFVLKVLFEQWQEETKKFKSPFFNYKNTEVNTALKNLVNTLSKNILIEKEDFRPLLEAAVNESIQLLFDPENYYLQQADSLSKNKDLRSISKYIKVHKPIFDQVALESEKHAEKALDAVISEVLAEVAIDADEQQKVMDAFNTVLVLNVLDEVEVETEKEETPLPEISATEAFDVGSDDAIDEEAVEADLKDEFEPLEDELDEKILPTRNINDKFGGNDIKTLNQQYEKEELAKTIAAKHEEQGISNLAASININQRYMFLSDLFDGNERDYSTALSTIDASESFDQSVEYLVQNFAKQYSWDMNSDEVKEFLKVIFKRFR